MAPMELAEDWPVEEFAQHQLDYKNLKKALKNPTGDAFKELLQQEHIKVGRFAEEQVSNLRGAVARLAEQAAGREHGHQAHRAQPTEQSNLNLMELLGECERLVCSIRGFAQYADVNRATFQRIVQRYRSRFHAEPDQVAQLPEPTLWYAGKEIEAWLLTPALECLKITGDPESAYCWPWGRFAFWAEELWAGCQLAQHRTDSTTDPGLVNTPLRLRLCSAEQKDLHLCVRRTFIECVGSNVSKRCHRRAQSQPASRVCYLDTDEQQPDEEPDVSPKDSLLAVRMAQLPSGKAAFDIPQPPSEEKLACLPCLPPSPPQDFLEVLASSDAGSSFGDLLTPDTEAAFWGLFSLGTVGHPHSCREACKYVGRKGGCRDGPNCTCCHLCRWQRKCVTDTAALAASLAEAGAKGAAATAAALEITGDNSPHGQQDLLVCVRRLIDSKGTGVQPLNSRPRPAPAVAGGPGKAWADVATKVGNDERDTLDPQRSTTTSGGSVAPPPACFTSANAEAAFWGLFSLGTMGHPHSCREACKYVGRKGGCRDGPNCTCCHLCRWQRRAPGDALVAAEPLKPGKAVEPFTKDVEPTADDCSAVKKAQAPLRMVASRGQPRLLPERTRCLAEPALTVNLNELD